MGRNLFVIGGARSGKSAYAEQLATDNFRALNHADASLYYLATAQAFDQEMQARIDLHQQRRNADWQTIDAPLDLPEKLVECSHQQAVILVDCLSIWTTNLLIHERDIEQARQALIDTLRECKGRIILVASETGLGIVPDNALSRRFRDANGLLNQAVTAAADEVFFMMAGIALRIKPPQ